MTTTNAKRVAEVSLKELARVALAVRDERDALRARCERLEAALTEVTNVAEEMLAERDSHLRTGMGELLARKATRAIIDSARAALAGEGTK